jgi:hypothetical protein
MLETCQICGKENLSVKELHEHIRSHKYTQKKYYLEFFPRIDPFDGKPLEFLNRSSYLEKTYRSLENLVRHLKEQKKEDGKKIILEIVKNRISRKGIEFGPSQVESRSLPIPPVSFFVDYFDDFESEFLEAGVPLRYSYPRVLESRPEFEGRISIDTREQNPLKFEGQRKRLVGLNYGDYVGENEKIVIERKSLSDFAGTLGSNFDRFSREILRGAIDGAYFVVVVEESLSNALKIQELSGKKRSYSRCSSGYIFHRLREITEKTVNIQFLFVKDREESEKYIKKIFGYDELVRNLDLQYLYDKKIL